MKHKSLFAALLALILPGSSIAGPVSSVATFTFDEKGNGFLGSTPVSYTQDTVTVSNPQGNGTMTVAALTYHIGAALQSAGLLASGGSPVAGDWHISDSGLSGSGPSDLLRWTNTGLLYVFSQPGGGELADVGVPFSNSGLFHVEVTYANGASGWDHTSVIDANNGFPNGEPGYIPGNIYYKFISDGTATPSVPEPSTLVLAAFGALSLAGYRSRRKMARTSAEPPTA